MDCPNCQKEVLALPGAKFCQFCGHELPPGPTAEVKLLTCSTCGQKALPEAKYCAECGEPLGEDHEHDHEYEGFDPGKRVACSDGMCIGIIGPEGKCNVCGKPYSGDALG